MLFIATVLGLALMAFTAKGYPWQSQVLWGHYLIPFQGWPWFGERRILIQAFLIFLPLLAVYGTVWPFFQGLFWGLGTLLFYTACFGLCSDGYRFIDYLGHFADPRLQGGTPSETCTEEQVSSTVPEPQGFGESQEILSAQSPDELYEILFAKPAPSSGTELRDAALNDAFTHLVIFLFTPWFWFVGLGPLVGLMIGLSVAIALSPALAPALQARLSTLVHGLSWLPARFFSLSVFFIQRRAHTTLREWWSLVKQADKTVPGVMQVTLQLSVLDVLPDAGGTGSKAWPRNCFIEAQALCQRAVMLWLGVMALFTLLL